MYSRYNPYDSMQERLDRARPAERRIGVGGLGKSVMKTLQSRERFGHEPIFDTVTVSESAEGMPAMKLEGMRKLWAEYPAIFGGRDEYSGELYYNRFLMPGEPFRLVASIEQLPVDIPDAFGSDRYRPAFRVTYVAKPLDPQSPSREFRRTRINSGRRRVFRAFERNAINLVDNLEGFRASPAYSSGILTPEQYRKKLMRLIRDYEDGIDSFDEPMPPEDYERMRALAEDLGFI